MAAGDPLKGTGGLCQIGVALSEVEVKYVTDWEYKVDVQTTEDGPFINRETIDEVAGGTKGELSINCSVREGGDPGQDDVLEALGLRRRLVFTTTGGKILTFASALVKAATVKTEAKGTQVMSFTVSGVAVITQDT